jgi:hypothetical protein
MANYIKVDSNKLVFNDSEQTTKDLDSLVKGENTTFAACDWTIDEDDMASDSDVHVPTEQSVKAYCDNNFALDSDLDVQSLTVTTVTTETANELTPVRGSKRNAYYVTALDDDAEIQAVSGTPAAGDTLLIGIKASGGDRTITWTASYVAIGGTLLATATNGKWIYMIFVYNGTDSKWHMLGDPVEEA